MEDVAADLGVTRNAVRSQFALLEREGIVEIQGKVRDAEIRRPFTGSDGGPSKGSYGAPGYRALRARLESEVQVRDWASRKRCKKKRGKGINFLTVKTLSAVRVRFTVQVLPVTFPPATTIFFYHFTPKPITMPWNPPVQLLASSSLMS